MQAPFVGILNRFTQAVFGVDEIENDTWRIIGSESRRQIGQRLRQSNGDDSFPIAGAADIQPGDAVWCTGQFDGIFGRGTKILRKRPAVPD